MGVPLMNIASMEARVRSRCDMVGSAFVTTLEVQNFMEAAWQDLYATASVQYEDLMIRQVDLPIVQGQGQMPLPLDVKRLRGLRIKNFEFLSPLSLREIRVLDRVGRNGRPRYYWMYGDSSFMIADILPYADTTYTITCYYQPAISLAEAAATFNAIQGFPQLACWDEYVVLSAAIKCKDKEESSTSTLMAERTVLLDNMKSSWTPTDTSEAARVVQLNSARNFTRAYDYQGPDDDY